MKAPFVHLHLHTYYSLLDGAVSIEKLGERLKELGMDCVAMTDHGNLFGAIEFYKAMTEHGIKPIIGMEAYVAKKSMEEKNSDEENYHLVLLARNEEGYRNLMKLSSIGYLEGFYYKPRIDREVLRKYSKGLIGLSSCMKGEIPSLILAGDPDTARDRAKEYMEIFDGNFYLEIMRLGLEGEREVNEELIKISRELDIPLVATNDVHYIYPEDHTMHDVLLAIQTGKELEDEERLRFSTREVYLKSPEEMQELFRDIPEAIENTVKIAEECNLLLDLDPSRVHLPHYSIPDEYENAYQYLHDLTMREAEKKYGKLTPEVKERLEHELSIIGNMGFAGYFLIIKDIVDFARKSGIRVGPGRGSAVGSAVLYVLGVTSVDPLKYNLLFERFLNPERVSMPDIDIDFEDTKRDMVIDYIKKKYGERSVAQIITFSMLKIRAALKDVARVYGIPFQEVNSLAKLIPDDAKSTKEAAERSPALKEKLKEERYKKIFEVVDSIIGFPRHASVHAAGVVITPGEITDYAPLYKDSKHNTVTTQYSMKSIELIGLLKVDILGLKTLTAIENTLRFLKEKGIELDVDNLPLVDEKVYELLSSGETMGIFQLESSELAVRTLKKIRPKNFEELIAILSLIRPGPMKFIDNYARRKAGKEEITYFHPKLKPVLEDTYGIPLYQEQVMQIAHVLAGFTMGEADILRRAMGKKDQEKMAEMEGKFVEGAVKNGIDEKTARDIFEKIKDFAQYGFNKSHSTGYAYISYITAYLKAHYPAEFMAATMTTEIGSQNASEKIRRLVHEARRMGIEVLSPDVNESRYEFYPTPDGKIRFGLGGIKNVGEKAAREIERKRPYENLFDFVRKVDTRDVDRRVMENLIMAGAMDCFSRNRASLLLSLPKAFELAEERGKRQTLSLFDTGKKEELEDVEDWEFEVRMMNEREAVGFYLSAHPLDEYGEILRYILTPSSRLSNLPDGKPVKVGGIITRIQRKRTRDDKELVILEVEDLDGKLKAVLYDVPTGKEELLLEDGKILIKGRVRSREEEGKEKEIRDDDIMPLDAVKGEIKEAFFAVNVEEVPAEEFRKVIDAVRSHSGSVPLTFVIKRDTERLKVRSGVNVSPSPELAKEVEKILGEGTVYYKV
ncbi:DNA polymerase III subunit alpha [bacterium]|nr:MAG: DNA polymerase III subunit alpha [bacterium]